MEWSKTLRWDGKIRGKEHQIPRRFEHLDLRATQVQAWNCCRVHNSFSFCTPFSVFCRCYSQCSCHRHSHLRWTKIDLVDYCRSNLWIIFHPKKPWYWKVGSACVRLSSLFRTGQTLLSSTYSHLNPREIFITTTVLQLKRKNIGTLPRSLNKNLLGIKVILEVSQHQILSFLLRQKNFGRRILRSPPPPVLGSFSET